ncbi:unnamed protein product [Rotaria sp. Silwood1]|nr:unnamed protein product [Rotaria sp. Silwood1]
MATQSIDSDNSDNDYLSDHSEWLKSAKKISTLYNYDQNLSDSEGHPFHKSFSREIIPEKHHEPEYYAVEYPIWQCDNVCGKKRMDIRYELLRTFHKLNKQRQDFHDYPSPVEDIIDPDLLVYQPDGVKQNASGYFEPSEMQPR